MILKPYFVVYPSPLSFIAYEPYSVFFSIFQHHLVTLRRMIATGATVWLVTAITGHAIPHSDLTPDKKHLSTTPPSQQQVRHGLHQDLVK